MTSYTPTYQNAYGEENNSVPLVREHDISRRLHYSDNRFEGNSTGITRVFHHPEHIDASSLWR